jgi:hypothetical protein
MTATARRIAEVSQGNEADRLFQLFFLGRMPMWQLRSEFARMVGSLKGTATDPFGKETASICEKFLARAVPTQMTLRREQLLAQPGFDSLRRAILFANLCLGGLRQAHRRYQTGEIDAATFLFMLEPESRIVRRLLAPGAEAARPQTHKRLQHFAEVAEALLSAPRPDRALFERSSLTRAILVQMVDRIRAINHELAQVPL